MVQKPSATGTHTGMPSLMNRIKESIRNHKPLNTKLIGNSIGASEKEHFLTLFETIRMLVAALIIYIITEDDYFEG